MVSMDNGFSSKCTLLATIAWNKYKTKMCVSAGFVALSFRHIHCHFSFDTVDVSLWFDAFFVSTTITNKMKKNKIQSKKPSSKWTFVCFEFSRSRDLYLRLSVLRKTTKKEQTRTFSLALVLYMPLILYFDYFANAWCIL